MQTAKQSAKERKTIYYKADRLDFLTLFKMDPTRTIKYIEADQDDLDEEVELAIKSTPEENLLRFCEVLSAQLAMQGIDLKTHPVERVIYYIDEPDT